MRTLPVFFALTLAPLQAQTPEVRTTAKDRTALSVTIYQNGLAAIRDTRRLNLPAGACRLAFADLVPTLRPKSATLLDPGGGIQVRERNYEFNLLSPGSLVDASLGLPVRINGEDGKADQVGTLASVPLLYPVLRRDANLLERLARKASAYAQQTDPNVVVASQDGLRSTSPGNLAFSQVPAQLRTSPTLLQDLVLDGLGPRDLTLLYTATDLTWTPHYVATLDMDGSHLDLDVFATVKNQSGGELPNATLQLLAGEPNLVYDPPPSDPNATRVDTTTMTVAASVASPPAFKEEKLSEYPLFTLDRPVTLARRSSKQLKLMDAKQIPIARRLLIEMPYQDYGLSPSSFLASELFQIEPPAPGFSPVPNGWRLTKPDEEVATSISKSAMAQIDHDQWMACHHPPVLAAGTLLNTKESNLGRSLPKGSLLLRYQDPAGVMVLLPGDQGSEAEFPQTPPGEEIDLIFGPARGLRVDRRATFQKPIPAKSFMDEAGKVHPQRRHEYGVQVQITNDLPSETKVTVREPITAGWRLLSSSYPGKRSGPDAYDFQVHVPAHGRATLRYAVRTEIERWAPE